MSSHLRSDAEPDINPVIKRTVSKNAPLTEDELSNALGRDKEVRAFPKLELNSSAPWLGRAQVFIASEGCGTSNHELQRRCDNLASLP